MFKEKFMEELLINYAKELHINLNEDKVKKFLKYYVTFFRYQHHF